MGELARAHKRKPSVQLKTTYWPLDRMVRDSLAYIREHEPPEGYFVGFSGGKDSIVTLELVRMSGVKHEAYYSATGIDPPEVMTFIRQHYPEVKWLHPEYSFWEWIQRKTPPLRTARWCCDVLKKNPSKKIPLKHRIMGIRAEESFARRNRPTTDFHKSLRQWVYKPIFHWLEWHVWDFIEKRDLPYPSLYDEGFHRIGCVVCPFISGGNLRAHKERWPKYYSTFEHACRKWWESIQSRRSGGVLERMNIQTFEEFMNFWYTG